MVVIVMNIGDKNQAWARACYSNPISFYLKALNLLSLKAHMNVGSRAMQEQLP